jgi:hypothetical protein
MRSALNAGMRRGKVQVPKGRLNLSNVLAIRKNAARRFGRTKELRLQLIKTPSSHSATQQQALAAKPFVHPGSVRGGPRRSRMPDKRPRRCQPSKLARSSWAKTQHSACLAPTAPPCTGVSGQQQQPVSAKAQTRRPKSEGRKKAETLTWPSQNQTKERATAEYAEYMEEHSFPLCFPRISRIPRLQIAAILRAI